MTLASLQLRVRARLAQDNLWRLVCNGGPLPFKLLPVGGWVRDVVQGWEPTDLDLIVATNDKEAVRSYVHELADRLGWSPVTLDSEHGYWRLATRQGEHIDFATLQGPNLNDDLSRRDFTVNAIAWDPEFQEFIDPFRGINDCQHNILRVTSEQVLAQDPIRTLRAWRFLATKSFIPSPELLVQVAHHTPLLANVAVERQNEELAHIFAGRIVETWDFAVKTGLVSALWPTLAAHPERAWQRLRLWKAWPEQLGAVAGRVAEGLLGYGATELRQGRSRYLLLGWALVLGLDGGELMGEAVKESAVIAKYMRRWALSRREAQALLAMWRYKSLSQCLLSAPSDPRSWYEFFRHAKDEAPLALIYAYLDALGQNSMLSEGAKGQAHSMVGELPSSELDVSPNTVPNGEACASLGLRANLYWPVFSAKVQSMVRDFLSRGSVSHPVVPLDGKAIQQRFPALSGVHIGRMLEHLALSSAERGGLSVEAAWEVAEKFAESYS